MFFASPLRRTPNSLRPANGILTGAGIWICDSCNPIEETLSRVLDHPYSFPPVRGNLRRAVVRRFPFAIFYEVTANEIEIIAVFHSRRNPEVWQSRVIRN